MDENTGVGVENQGTANLLAEDLHDQEPRSDFYASGPEDILPVMNPSGSAIDPADGLRLT